MALQTVRLGSAKDIFQYDDTDFISGIKTSAPIATRTGTAPDHVALISDLETTGVTRSFTTADSKTVTVVSGLITSIV